MEKQLKPVPMGAFGGKTILTAVVYYSHKMNGEAYTYAEKQAKENRFFHPSFDFVLTEKGARVTTHNQAYEKMMGMLQRKRSTIITALVEANMSDGVYRVAKITRHSIQIYAKPVYGIGKELNDVIIRRWEGNPLKMERKKAA